MNHIPDYRGFKAVNEKTNFILGPSPQGDPHKEYNKPFFIEVKKKKKLENKIKSIPNLSVEWRKGTFGDVAKIEGGTNQTLQDLLDVLDDRKDGIQSMGWIDLEETVTEVYADDAFDSAWQQMLNTAKGLKAKLNGKKGFAIKSKDLKGTFKITLDKGKGDWDSTVEIIWPDGHKEESPLHKAQDILRKIAQPKIGKDWEAMKKESVDEAAPKMTHHADVGFVADLITRLAGIGRRHKGAAIIKDAKKATKALESLLDSIKREANIPF